MAGLNLFTRNAEVTYHTPPSPNEAIEMAADLTGPVIHSVGIKLRHPQRTDQVEETTYERDPGEHGNPDRLSEAHAQR